MNTKNKPNKARRSRSVEQWWADHAKLLAARMKLCGVKSFRIELNARGNYEFEAVPMKGMAGSADVCDHCDTFGGEKTYANQACLPLNGKVVCVDWCIHQLVAALNAGGVQTVACCCGHGRQPGRIDLADGRILLIHTHLKYLRELEKQIEDIECAHNKTTK